MPDEALGLPSKAAKGLATGLGDWVTCAWGGITGLAAGVMTDPVAFG
jgi:hypothetical protein